MWSPATQAAGSPDADAPTLPTAEHAQVGAMAVSARSAKVLRHLCVRADFLRVQGGGRRFRGQYLALLVAPAPDYAQGGSRLGLTVSRKVGNAVVRNRVRRVLRECWRQAAGRPLPAMDHVLIAFPQAKAMPFAAAQSELACLLAKAAAWHRSHASAMRPLPCTG